MKYTIISQNLISEDLTYIVNGNDSNHLLSTKGLSDEKFKPEAPLEHFKSFEFDPDSWNCKSDLTQLLKTIRNTLNGDKLSSLLFACYAVLTYGFQLFGGIPQLWIQVPDKIDRLNIKNLISALCFNIIPLSPKQSLEGISHLIGNFSPTLLIDSSSAGKSSQLQNLVNQPIQRVIKDYNKTGAASSTYCPRIVISPHRPGNTILEHTVLIEVFNTTQSAPIKSELNLDIVKYALSVQNQLKSDDATLFADCFIPMQKIGKSFLEMGLIDQDLEEKYQLFISDKINGLNGYSLESEIFEAILEYLEKVPKDELYPLCDIGAFVKNRTDMPNPQVLSRLLNKYGLIKNTKRDRVLLKFAAVLGGKRENKQQRTCVEIDKKRLEHLSERYK